MYKKKVLLLLTTIVSVFSLGIVFLTNANNMDFSNFAFATSEPYSISMSSTKNKLFSETGSTPYSGNSDLKTGLGNDITFTYYELMGLNNTWHVLKDNGYFQNADAINGMDHINVTFKNSGMSYKLYWSYDTNFSESKVYNGITSTESPLSFDFNSEHPAYLKFINTSGSNLNISAVNIIFSCSVASFNVSAVSEDVNKGTVTGSGNYNYGASVTLSALPKAGYDFFGWYIDDVLVEKTPTFTFTMDDHSRSYLAKFVVAYPLYVYSENENHGTVSAPIECGVGNSVTITASAARGCTFDYWFDEDLNIVSYDSTYTFVMPNNEVTLFASFKEGFDIAVFSKNSEELNLSGSGHYLIDDEVTLSAELTNDRGTFIGWFNGRELLSSNMTYSFACQESLNIEAKWHDLYTYNGTVSGPKTVTQHVSLPIPTYVISNSAFKDCVTLVSVDCPNTLETILPQAFFGCSSLTTFEVFDGLETIGQNSFYGCVSLSNIVLPSTVQTIDATAFYGCSSLTTDSLSALFKENTSTLYTIGSNAFAYCDSIDTLVIPNSVTNIGYQAFSYCTSLQSVTISSHIQKIEQGLFRGCTSLENIRFSGSVASWNYLTKENYWNLDVPATQVVCSDGVVTL